MDLKGIRVVIGADLSEFNRGMGNVEGRLGRLGGTLRGIGSVGAVALGAIVSGLGALASVTATVGVRYSAMMEQSKIAWGSILQDQELAIETLRRLEEMGTKTPFRFEGLDRSAKLLNMAGFEGESLFETLTKVGDAVSAIGGSDVELEGVSMAIFQMASKGKISAQEMNQLAERGIPAWQIIADAMGLSVGELMDMGAQGELFAKDVLPLLVDGLGKRFAGSMEAQSKTFNGRLATMTDTLKILASELAKPLFEKLKGGMEAVQPVLDAFLAFIQGNVSEARDILERAFGAETAGKIIAFGGAVGSAFSTVKGWLEIGLQAVKALFEYITGDTAGAEAILTKLGLDPEVVSKITSIVTTVSTTIRDFVSNVIEYYRDLFSGEGNIGESFVRIFNVIKTIALPILQDAVNFIKERLGMIKQFWDENGAQIIEAVQNAWNIIAGIFEFITPVILFIVKFLWDSVKGVIDGALNIIMGIIKIFAGLFTGDFSKMWEGIKQLFFGALEFLWNLMNLVFIGRIIGSVKSFGTMIVKFFKGMWTTITTNWRVPINALWKFVDDFVYAIKDFFISMKQQGETTIGAMWKTIRFIFTNAVNGVKAIATGFWNALRAIFNGIKTTASTTWNTIKTVATTVWSALRNVVTGIVRGLSSGLSGIWNGIKTTAITIWNALRTAVVNTVNFLSSSVTEKFNAIRSTASRIFEAVRSAITRPIERAKDVVLGIVDAIRGAFNRMKIQIPKPRLPRVNVSMRRGIMGIPYPDFDVSWNKDGGIWDGASVIGIGEAGPEAVVPLQGHRMRPFAETIAKEMPNGVGGGSGLTVQVEQLVVREEADIKRVAQELYGLQQRELRQGGRG